MYEEIEAAARSAMAELLETAKVPAGGLVVVGCWMMSPWNIWK